MSDIFRTYLADKIALTHQEYELIESVLSVKKLRKRQYLLQTGEVCSFNVFVGQGFLKHYFVDGKGQEHIMQFVPENYWTADRESMDSGLPSKYNIDALEDSIVLLLKKDDFEMIRKAIPTFGDFVDESLRRNIAVLQERIHDNISLSAEERYFKFLSKYPSLSNRVPLHMVASYLGVSAETLSRIRSQSSKK